MLARLFDYLTGMLFIVLLVGFFLVFGFLALGQLKYSPIPSVHPQSLEPDT